MPDHRGLTPHPGDFLFGVQTESFFFIVISKITTVGFSKFWLRYTNRCMRPLTEEETKIFFEKLAK